MPSMHDGLCSTSKQSGLRKPHGSLEMLVLVLTGAERINQIKCWVSVVRGYKILKETINSESSG